MPIRAKKNNLWCSTLLVGMIGISCAVAQTNSASNNSSDAQEDAAKSAPTTSTAENQITPASPNTAGSATASNAGNAGENSTGTTLDYLFNHKPQEGSMAAQAAQAQKQAATKEQASEALGGRNISDGQVRARFERYLGTPEVPAEQAKAYADGANQIVAMLRQGQTFAAWKSLYQLATYRSIDLGMSAELANRIESVWNTDKTSDKIDNKNSSLQQQIETDSRNADIMSRTNRQKDLDVSRQESSRNPKKRSNNGGVPQEGDVDGSNSTPDVSGMEGKLELTQTYLNSLEAKAKIKLNELRAQKLLDSAKSDFAGYINTLASNHHYEHVILAAEFYRRIFDEDTYPVAIANQVNAALEQQREVQSTIDVFNYNLDKNNVVAATDRLQEAFLAGEFEPSVSAVKRTAKDRVAAYLAKIDKLANLIEAKDFGNLSTTLDEMKQLAADFDTTKPVAIVNAVKLESRMRMGKAKLAAQKGDLKTAMDEFQAAAEAWPDNPDLQSNANNFFNSQDAQNQSTGDFDRYVQEGNYRAIFDKQLMFAPAIHGDAKREQQLKDAIEKTQKAEVAIQKAGVMSANGDVYGAWETINLAVKDLPDDNKLNSMLGNLAGKGAEFVAAVNHAQEAEARNDFGYSLTWYAIAQRYYPASTIANQAIDRISKKILGMN